MILYRNTRLSKTTYTLTNKGKKMYRLGIDLGGTNIVAGIVDENCKIISTAKRKTNCPRPSEKIADDIAEASFEAIEKAGITLGDISVAGIGAPGDIDVKNGIILLADNLEFVNVPIVKMLQERMGISFNIQNDANAAAYGEYIAGAGKGTKDFIMLTLGTGVGGGVVINGNLYAGFSNKGAELGHSVINIDGEMCSCGRRGCLEAYASATALIRQTKAAMQQNKQSIMWQLCDNDLDNVTGITAFEAMRKGDPTAKQVVDKYIYYISVGIVDNIYVFQPEVICLGGGISGEGDSLIAPIIENVKNQIPSFNPQIDTKIKIAELGNDAGIIGAAYI